jgi:hypothetical protein
MTTTGHCECGRVQFEFDCEINDFSHCHCSQCRRLHGAAYATYGGVARDKFRYVQGASDVKTYASSATHDRKFCATCGSSILVDLKTDPDSVYVAMGTVDGNPAHPPAYHIYVGSKAAWHEINDNALQFETVPEE